MNRDLRWRHHHAKSAADEKRQSQDHQGRADGDRGRKQHEGQRREPKSKLQEQLQGAPEETAPAQGGADDEADKTKSKKKGDLFGP